MLSTLRSNVFVLSRINYRKTHHAIPTKNASTYPIVFMVRR